MRRRIILALFSAALASAGAGGNAAAQSSARIGVLSPLSSGALNSAPFEAFRNALRDLGRVEGKNIELIYRWADGDQQKLAVEAAELARRGVDVIFAIPGTPAVIAAKKATATIPIVFVGVGDAVGSGLVESLARPGGNATGLVNQSQDISGKQLEVLKEAIPSLSRVAVLWRPSNPSYKNLLSRFDDVVKAKKIEVVLTAAESGDEISLAFDAMRTNGINGVLVQADDLFIEQGPRIIALAAAHRLPAIYRIGEQASAGGLMAYGPNIPDMYREAASYVDKLLKGAKASDLPVEQPTKIELVVNLKTAKTLGIEIPPALLVRADVVIE
jgi:putative ABC transport system substrate-binding protein